MALRMVFGVLFGSVTDGIDPGSDIFYCGPNNRVRFVIALVPVAFAPMAEAAGRQKNRYSSFSISQPSRSWSRSQIGRCFHCS